jgi:putative hydrolase of the HAD superfamily
LGIWLNRSGEQAPGFRGQEIASLLELLALPAGSS